MTEATPSQPADDPRAQSTNDQRAHLADDPRVTPSARNARDAFAEYLPRIADHPHRDEFLAVLDRVLADHPELTPVVKWNQPMFTHHGTFIIGFSAAARHFSVAPEVLDDVIDVVTEAGYSHGSKLFRVPFGQAVNFAVIDHVIDHNLKVKADTTTFWRS